MAPSVSETLPQHLISMPQPFFGSSHFSGDLSHITTTDILEFTSFEQIPNSLLWVEFGRIARQAFQMQPFGCSSRAKSP